MEEGKGAAGEPWRICLSVWIYLSLCVRPQLSWIYIEEKIQKSGVTHAEIEVEFDRMLLEKHGHNPITSHLTNHIPTDATCAGVIAEFFPEVTKQEVQQAVSGCNSVSSTVDL